MFERPIQHGKKGGITMAALRIRAPQVSSSSLFTVVPTEGSAQLLSTLSRSLTAGLSCPSPPSPCKSWRAEGSAWFLHHQAPPRLDPHSANSTYCLLAFSYTRCILPLPLTDLDTEQNTLRRISLSASKEGYVFCYFSRSVPFSVFFSRAVDSHCIISAYCRTPSYCKGSASIRAPIIIPNQSQFSI